MNLKILNRKALMGCFFLLLAGSPGFGELNLTNFNKKANNGFTKMTDETILNFKKDNFGFELHCACGAAKEAPMPMQEGRGFVSAEFIE